MPIMCFLLSIASAILSESSISARSVEQFCLNPYCCSYRISCLFPGLTQIFDNNFKTVKDNSNLKQTWTTEIVSLHFWRISFRTVQGQLRSICSIGWENLYFCQIASFSLLTQKLFNRFAQNYQVNCAFWNRLDNPGVNELFWRHLAEINAKKTAKICSKYYKGWL